MTGKVIAVNVSHQKGVRKDNQVFGQLIMGQGLANDAHAGEGHKQVSLLAIESINKMKNMGLDVGPGDFAENITTSGLNLLLLPIGARLSIGESLIAVTQIGKECHKKCAIFYQAGECVMPTEGIFAEVLMGGLVKPQDAISVWPDFKVLIITLSDRCYRGEREDQSGPAIKSLFERYGAQADYLLLPDEREMLEKAIKCAADERQVDVVVTTGGTGLSPRDITPEATRACIDREIPGIAEAMRSISLAKTKNAMLSRAVVGIRGKTIVANLPGSTPGALENVAVLLSILPHALETLSGKTMDCGK
ncbi:MAG: molybdopterin-binding protein [bacterium]|nr:molybdopterin-binding protein [bacterium]